MAMVTCPRCRLRISNRVRDCFCCGYPTARIPVPREQDPFRNPAYTSSAPAPYEAVPSAEAPAPFVPHPEPEAPAPFVPNPAFAQTPAGETPEPLKKPENKEKDNDKAGKFMPWIIAGIVISVLVIIVLIIIILKMRADEYNNDYYPDEVVELDETPVDASEAEPVPEPVQDIPEEAPTEVIQRPEGDTDPAETAVSENAPEEPAETAVEEAPPESTASGNNPAPEERTASGNNGEERNTSTGEALNRDKAMESAEKHLNAENEAYSRNGLIDKLQSEGFSNTDATYAADNSNADWEEQALKSAEHHMQNETHSYNDLISVLENEKFTNDEAVYGADFCGADWYDQAIKKGREHLDSGSYSFDSLVEQLEADGFAYEEATYAATELIE